MGLGCSKGGGAVESAAEEKGASEGKGASEEKGVTREEEASGEMAEVKAKCMGGYEKLQAAPDCKSLLKKHLTKAVSFVPFFAFVSVLRFRHS